jgi:hypothetical protein
VAEVDPEMELLGPLVGVAVAELLLELAELGRVLFDAYSAFFHSKHQYKRLLKHRPQI